MTTTKQQASFLIKSQIHKISSLDATKIYTLIQQGIMSIKLSDIIKEQKIKAVVRANPNSIKEVGGEYYFSGTIINGIIEMITHSNKLKKVQFSNSYDLMKEDFKDDSEIVVQKNFNKNLVDGIMCKCNDAHFIFNRDLKVKSLDVNDTSLQIISAQISSGQTDISYPLQLTYRCNNPDCNCFEHTRYMYEVLSKEYRSNCPNVLTTADGKLKKCGNVLRPVKEVSQHRNIYFQTINVFFDGKYHNLNGVSLLSLSPGNYNMAVFVTYDNQPQLFIIAVDEIKKKEVEIKPKNDEHYIKTLRKDFDKLIQDSIGVQVSGYDVIKEWFIIRRFCQMFFKRSNLNMALVGSKGVGKTFVPKMYMPCLSNNILFTNVNSISIPSLRGTEKTITLLNKKMSVSTVGQLGSYDDIYVDEMFEDREILDFLKQFLLENDYGNFKANGDDVLKKKTAQMVISANINRLHLLGYRKKVREFYYELLATSQGGSVDEKDVVSSRTNLFLRLGDYNDRPILKQALIKTREHYKVNDINWIDGNGAPAMDRFPLKVYLRGDDDYSDDKILRDMRNALRTEESYLDTINKLNNNLMEKFFSTINSDIKDPQDAFTDEELRIVLDKQKVIVNKYELDCDSRFTTVFTTLCAALKLINKEKVISEETFEIIDKYYSCMGRMIDIKELTYEYKPTRKELLYALNDELEEGFDGPEIDVAVGFNLEGIE